MAEAGAAAWPSGERALLVARAWPDGSQMASLKCRISIIIISVADGRTKFFGSARPAGVTRLVCGARQFPPGPPNGPPSPLCGSNFLQHFPSD